MMVRQYMRQALTQSYVKQMTQRDQRVWQSKTTMIILDPNMNSLIDTINYRLMWYLHKLENILALYSKAEKGSPIQ